MESCKLPLLYLHNATLVLKKPSFLTDVKATTTKVKLESTEKEHLSILKKKEGLDDKPIINPFLEKRKEKLMKKIEQRKLERVQAKEQKLKRKSKVTGKKERKMEQDSKSRCRNRRKRHVPKNIGSDVATTASD